MSRKMALILAGILILGGIIASWAARHGDTPTAVIVMIVAILAFTYLPYRRR